MLNNYYEFLVKEYRTANAYYIAHRTIYGTSESLSYVSLKLNVQIAEVKLEFFKSIFGRWINE